MALNEDAKAYVLQHPPLYQALLRAAMRFIGGQTLAQCVAAARALNGQGHAVTIDYMGESTRDAAGAEQATHEFLAVIQAIATAQIDASVSFDLSHIGMVIDPELGYQNASTLAEAARAAEIELMISMEGTDRTSLILDIHGRLCERFDNVGVTLQAYLYRTPADLASALTRAGKIRLVKGAYEAPASLAQARGASLDTAYRQLMETLFAAGHRCSVATHDPLLLDHARTYVEAHAVDREKIEFEMLKGVTAERLQALRDQGYRTRVYLPYGQEWYLYLCNRLAEYPPNVYQAIVDAVYGVSDQAPR
jgi:proline dehydrogenase